MDLQVGTGSELSVVAGDQVGVVYTGWLRGRLEPLKGGAQFDQNNNKNKTNNNSSNNRYDCNYGAVLMTSCPWQCHFDSFERLSLLFFGAIPGQTNMQKCSFS